MRGVVYLLEPERRTAIERVHEVGGPSDVVISEYRLPDRAFCENGHCVDRDCKRLNRMMSGVRAAQPRKFSVRQESIRHGARYPRRSTPDKTTISQGRSPPASGSQLTQVYLDRGVGIVAASRSACRHTRRGWAVCDARLPLPATSPTSPSAMTKPDRKHARRTRCVGSERTQVALRPLHR